MPAPPAAEDFESVVRAHSGAVRAFLRRLTGEHAHADELAQETFLKAYRVRDRLEGVENVRSWLYRIAYRRFLDDRRRNLRRDALAPQPQPAHVTPNGGLALDVTRAMDGLPPERRACAMLHLALGHSHASVADITGLPLGTVKSHIKRAKAALQEALHVYQ